MVSLSRHEQMAIMWKSERVQCRLNPLSEPLLGFPDRICVYICVCTCIYVCVGIFLHARYCQGCDWDLWLIPFLGCQLWLDFEGIPDPAAPLLNLVNPENIMEHVISLFLHRCCHCSFTITVTYSILIADHIRGHLFQFQLQLTCSAAILIGVITLSGVAPCIPVILSKVVNILIFIFLLDFWTALLGDSATK